MPKSPLILMGKELVFWVLSLRDMSLQRVLLTALFSTAVHMYTFIFFSKRY